MDTIVVILCALRCVMSEQDGDLPSLPRLDRVPGEVRERRPWRALVLLWVKPVEVFRQLLYDQSVGQVLSEFPGLGVSTDVKE
jgi:hypothetical protein